MPARKRGRKPMEVALCSSCYAKQARTDGLCKTCYNRRYMRRYRVRIQTAQLHSEKG